MQWCDDHCLEPEMGTHGLMGDCVQRGTEKKQAGVPGGEFG